MRRTALLGAVLPLAVLVLGADGSHAVLKDSRLATVAYANGNNADVGLSFVGQWGGNAAAADRRAGIPVRWDATGQCITFVWSVVALASHGRVSLSTASPVYYDAYVKAGASIVSTNSASKGDVIQIFNPAAPRSYYPGMHTAIIVANLGGGNFDVVDSNYQLPIDNYQLERVHHHTFNPFNLAAAHGLSVALWHFGVAPESGGIAVRSDGSGFTVDGAGVISSFGGAPPAITSTTWPGQDIVRGITLRPDGLSGYVLDLFGGLHPFAEAGTHMPTTPTISGYWANWDIARAVVSLTGQDAGYVLDGFGGLHSFAGAGTAVPATPTISGYWAYWDIARSIAVLPNQAAGFVLDGFGGLHPFVGPGASWPGAVNGVAYWTNWDIARGVVLVSGGTQPSGYTLDGYGGIHAFGDAPIAHPTAYWPGDDVARGIAVTPGSSVDHVLGHFRSAAGTVESFSSVSGCSTCQ